MKRNEKGTRKELWQNVERKSKTNEEEREKKK